MLLKKHFCEHDSSRKRSVLEQSLLERLENDDDDSLLKKAVDIVEKHTGQEEQLYDMISEMGTQAINDKFRGANSTHLNKTMRNSTDLQIDDLLGIGGAGGGDIHALRDDSLVYKIKNVATDNDAVHVDGAPLSRSGKEQKLCEMFMSPATTKTVQKEGRDYLVLRHPGAKIMFERPSGIAWFTCRPGHDVAMKRAAHLKTEWEKVFQTKASNYGGAKICLSASGSCAICKVLDNTIKVKTWSVISGDSLTGQTMSVQGDNKAGGKLRQVRDQYLKKRNKGAIAHQSHP